MKVFFRPYWSSVFTILLIHAFSVSLFAQQPVYKNYTINSGLPSQVVYCVTQDAKGYLWFGTDAGASRFDGKNFENFTIQDGLSDNEILNIHKDSKGRLWFFTLNGKLSYFLNDSFFNGANDSRLALAKTKFEAISFMEDTDSNIWIGSKSTQLFNFNNNGTSRLFDLDTVFRHPDNSSYNWVFTYAPSKDKIWIMIGYHASKIFEYTNNSFKAISDQTVIEPLSNNFYLQQTGLNAALFNGNSGICNIEDGKSKTIIARSAIPDYSLDSRFFVDRKLDVWITGADNTILHFKNIRGNYYFDHSYFLDARVGGICIDTEGNSWFTTTGGGVYKLSPNSEYMKIYPGVINAADNAIECVKGDNNGKIWFSSRKGNLYQLKNDSLIKYSIKPGNSVPGIKNFEIDKNGDLYCITGEGLFLLRKTSSGYDQFTKIPAKNNGIYYDFRAGKFPKFDHYGKLFISSSTGFFQLSSGNHHVEYVPFNSLMTHRIYCLYFDTQNNFWFENFEKLLCYNGKELITFPHLDKEFLSQITSINGISDSILVIATYGSGINFFKNGKVINKVTSAQGLAGNLCRQIFIEHDTVYVSTNQGFSSFTYHNNIVSNIKTFSVNEGMPTGDVRCIYAQQGKIYVATSSGLCIIDKHLTIQQTNIDPPAIYFKSILINGNKFTETKLKASYNADITVNYIAITFDQPEKIVYQYNLTSNENGWIETKNTTAILASLKPGDYRFSLRAKKHNSDWSNPINFQLSIIPPYWQKWWFRALSVAVLLITVYYIIKYITVRNYRIRLQQAKAQQALAEERNRISSDMHDDLGADLSNILLLTRISNSRNTVDPESKKQISEIEQFTTRVIHKVDEIIWALNPAQDTLQSLLEFITDYCGRFLHYDFMKGKIIECETVPDKIISSAFRRNIFLVIKEAMNNIVKHSGAKDFRLELKIVDEILSVYMEDNGNGFNDNEELERGNGLLNMKKRIGELNGSLTINSIPGVGTKLYISVPLP